jgi:hypothetical protein
LREGSRAGLLRTSTHPPFGNVPSLLNIENDKTIPRSPSPRRDLQPISAPDHSAVFAALTRRPV